MIQTKTVRSFLPVLFLWMGVVIPYILRTPDRAYTHDFEGHVQYTQILHDAQRFPVAGEGDETFQPPLFYLIASQLGYSTGQHLRCVRFFAAALGAGVLAMLAILLQALGIQPFIRNSLLMLLATTPHFVFVFSGYNNDVFSVFFACLVWALFFRFAHTPTWKLAGAMGAVTALGGLSKLGFGAAVVALGVVAVYWTRQGRLTQRGMKRFVIAQLIALLPILAWMVSHNLKTSGHLLSLNVITMQAQTLPHSALRTILTPPGFTHAEWITPFADSYLPIGKKNSLTAYAWVTSIFGEYSFYQLPGIVAWVIFWIHSALGILAFTRLRASEMNTTFGLAIVLGWLALAAYLYKIPVASAMDFRHVAWLWLPLTLLEAEALQHTFTQKGVNGQRLLLGAIGLGVLLQWSLIAAL